MIKLVNVLKELVTTTEIICDKCGWNWKIKDGGNDLYICHKCNHDNTPEQLKESTKLEKSPAYMYSPVGFGCHVCKFYYVEDKKHMCGNSYYQKHMGTAELVDNEGNQIKDPSKWCSNWFLPKGE